jgi:hypothetical protein
MPLAPSPHVAHVRLALLLHTRESPSSNLGADIDYPKFFSGFTQSLEAEIHHHHHISVMELGPLLTRSGLTHENMTHMHCMLDT